MSEGNLVLAILYLVLIQDTKWCESQILSLIHQPRRCRHDPRHHSPRWLVMHTVDSFSLRLPKISLRICLLIRSSLNRKKYYIKFIQPWRQNHWCVQKCVGVICFHVWVIGLYSWLLKLSCSVLQKVYLYFRGNKWCVNLGRVPFRCLVLPFVELFSIFLPSSIVILLSLR